MPKDGNINPPGLSASDPNWKVDFHVFRAQSIFMHQRPLHTLPNQFLRCLFEPFAGNLVLEHSLRHGIVTESHRAIHKRRCFALIKERFLYHTVTPTAATDDGYF